MRTYAVGMTVAVEVGRASAEQSDLAMAMRDGPLLEPVKARRQLFA